MQTSWNVQNFLDQLAQELPIVRPLGEFLHLNLLRPYQHRPFWEAIKEVGCKFEALTLHSMNFYREKVARGELPLELVHQKLVSLTQHEKTLEDIQRILEKNPSLLQHDLRAGKLHSLWHEELGVPLSGLADSLAIKWVGMFLDQGVAQWEMPGASDKTFYEVICDLLQESLVRPSPFRKLKLEEFFLPSPQESIEKHLRFLCPQPEFQHSYLRESVFTLRGWGGLIYSLEKNPELLVFKRKIDLTQFVALKLILERAWIQKIAPKAQAPNFSSIKHIKCEHPFDDEEYFFCLRALQEALEEVQIQKFLLAFQGPSLKSKETRSFQAVFCMDDRETALRCQLERLTEEVQTYGTAGHFGVNCLYHSSEEALPQKHCPASLSPRVLIKEKVSEFIPPKGTPFSFIRPHSALWGDFFHSLAAGPRSGWLLALNLYAPFKFKRWENVKEAPSTVELEFDESQSYSLKDMAHIVYEQLQLIGLVQNFAPMIFIIGHHSSSVNNPYAVAYGCGAASGRSGGPNARAWVMMANRDDVREYLQQYFQFYLPTETVFVAGLHDTCRDEVKFYDTHKLSSFHREQYLKFKRIMTVALAKNARERGRRFPWGGISPQGLKAQAAAFKRSTSLFETRPELGHTDVSFAWVGKKGVPPQKLFFRPGFWQTYDRDTDPEGEYLTTILKALVPVCAGIALDYFFSCVDNLRLGAGSKLPQNIVGQVGVVHGTESDLLVGLPLQMIDQHTPLRLFLLLEQSPEVAIKAICSQAEVQELVFNQWIYFGCWDEKTQSMYMFKDGEMKRC